MKRIFEKLEWRYALWRQTRVYRKQFRTLKDVEREQAAYLAELDDYKKLCRSHKDDEFCCAFYISQMVGIADRLYCLDTVHKELLLKKFRKGT